MNSPKQLQEILFGRLGIDSKGLKKTPTGAISVNEDALEKLAADHPLPKLLLEYRGLAKLKSTYTDKLPTMIHPDTGRVHTLVAFTTMTVDYVISSSTREQVISAGTQVKGALRVIAENSEGTNRDYYLPSVTLAPNGDFVLKGDGTSWLTMKLDMEVLKKDDSTAAVYIDGRAA